MNNNVNKLLLSKLLALAGFANILIALLHLAMLFIGARAYEYFGAPASFVQHPGTSATIVQMLILTAFFIVVGLYALSGAGLIRRFPLTKTVLIIVGVIYTLRGAMFFLIPFPSLINKIMTGFPNILGQIRPIMLQDWFFSFIALCIGIILPPVSADHLLREYDGH